MPDALQKPFAITRFGGKDKGYRLYTTMKNENGETIVVGVDVKNVGRDMEVNAISTIFGRRGDAKKTQKEDVLYTAENITPEQRSLLGQPNSDQYTGVRERNVSTDKGSEKAEKKQEKQSVFDKADKAKEIADKEEKKRKAEADKPKQKPLTEAERKDAEEVAGALGYRVEWVDTMEENGTIDADKKVIRIAKDAENPLVQALGHEVAHGVKRMDGVSRFLVGINFRHSNVMPNFAVWKTITYRRLTAGVLTYVTEVEGFGRTYAITHIDALRALQHDVDAISDQLNRHRDNLKYDEEQLKRANEWRAEAELYYDYRQ